ncbi:MAG: sigma 54-interacting transcriptional regulator [Clostridiales bacterium]|nr:sigma 54-interacting transcriptional regulator [Clostridiales bacterium]
MNDFMKIITKDELLPILDSISDAVFIDDKDGIALWCNKACWELYKVVPADICGKHVSTLEKMGIFTPSVAALVLKKKEEVTIIHENRHGKRLLSTSTPIFDKDRNIAKIVTTSRDITELVTLQERLDFAHSTIKELKSPDKFSRHGLIAVSEAMHNVLVLIKRLSSIDTTVLITGESGTGKGVVAKLLHENGPRNDFPFTKINCGAIPETLIESELFGYERGAFTGSRSDGKKGLFEVSQDGTVFLDEISELPLNLQVKLLQVIQEKEIVKVGGVKSIPVNVRVISATNKDLFDLVQKNKFREDLYYRLNVIPINVPPLRERHEDIKPLIQHFLDMYNEKLDCRKIIDANAIAMLLRYNWPGNVRELQNIVERLLITTKSDIILPEHIPSFIAAASAQHQAPKDEAGTLKQAVDMAERDLLLKACRRCKSTREIAKALSISQPSVVRKLKKHGIALDSFLNH